MNEVIFGLGANIGEPVSQLAAAVERLETVVDLVAVSGVYRTQPVGFLEQPDFFNLVLVGRSASAPDSLLEEAVRIEREMGRTRTFANAPRTIDIDLLAWSGPPLDTPQLTIPHPRLHLRSFVLGPLAEVAPAWRHPFSGLTALEMLAALESPGAIERIGELPTRG